MGQRRPPASAPQSRHGAELDGRPLDLATLRGEVDKAQEIAERQGKSWSGGVVLAIAPDVTARAILPILDMLEETGFTDITFVAQARGGPEIPQLPAPEVTAELDARAAAMPADAHHPYLAARRQLLDVEAARCPQLTGALEAPLSLPYDQPCLGLGLAVLAACDTCQCAADVLRALRLAMTPMLPQALTIERRFARDSEAPSLSAHPDELWSDLAPRLFATPAPSSALFRTNNNRTQGHLPTFTSHPCDEQHHHKRPAGRGGNVWHSECAIRPAPARSMATTHGGGMVSMFVHPSWLLPTVPQLGSN